MDITGSFRVAVDRGTAWRFLTDIPSMAPCLPGCEEVEAVGDNRFRGVLAAKVGPIKAKFQGQMEIVRSEEPDLVECQITGADRITGTKVETRLTLDFQGEGADGRETTRVSYVARVTLQGRLAQFGHSIVRSETEKMLREFEKNVDRRLAPTNAPSGT